METFESIFLNAPSQTFLAAPRTNQAVYRMAQKLAPFLRLNFTKYQPIFKINSLPESG